MMSSGFEEDLSLKSYFTAIESTLRNANISSSNHGHNVPTKSRQSSTEVMKIKTLCDLNS
jgi:hypothetical protein